MLYHSWLLIILGLALVIGIWIFYNSLPSVKAKKKIEREAEESERLRLEEEQKKREQKSADEERVRKDEVAKGLEHLRNHCCLAVCIREKDGRKGTFETAVIRAFLKKEINLVSLSDVEERAITKGGLPPKGIFVLGATTWNSLENVDNEWGSRTYRLYHCDYRLWTEADGKGKFLAANYLKCTDEETLAALIVECASPSFSEF